MKIFSLIFISLIFVLPGYAQRAAGQLPLSVKSFSAARINSAVSLNWKIEAGMNVSSFRVERSLDNIKFISIGSVAGKSSSTGVQSYTYTDSTNKSTAVSFYRLRMVKQSGEVSYSDIKTVKAFAVKAGFVLFPNPAVANAKVTIADLIEPTKIELFDNSGRLVKTVTLTSSNTVELNGLQKGAYIVRISGNVSGQTEVKKLTVIN